MRILIVEDEPKMGRALVRGPEHEHVVLDLMRPGRDRVGVCSELRARGRWARGTRVLVVGDIHGNECAGLAVARALERVYRGADLWIVANLNPDGLAGGTCQNDRGVDPDANWSSRWRSGGTAWDVCHSGPSPFSELETQIARRLILRIRPRATIWFQQHMNWCGHGGRAARRGGSTPARPACASSLTMASRHRQQLVEPPHVKDGRLHVGALRHLLLARERRQEQP